jgi:hypothetical protein
MLPLEWPGDKSVRIMRFHPFADREEVFIIFQVIAQLCFGKSFLDLGNAFDVVHVDVGGEYIRKNSVSFIASCRGFYSIMSILGQPFFWKRVLNLPIIEAMILSTDKGMRKENLDSKEKI